jgi:prophage maintenance system killer protein
MSKDFDAQETNPTQAQNAWSYPSQGARTEPRTGVQQVPPWPAQDPQGTPLRRIAQEDEPYFPTADEATELNQNAIGLYGKLFGDSPEWGGVLKPNELESALASAKNHYHYDPEPDDARRYVQGAAKAAWRIAGNQVFANGNKRTAFGTMKGMLDQTGLGHLSPHDYPDDEFVDHLIGQDSYGKDTPPEQLPAERARLEQEFLGMWDRRYQQGGPDPNYQQKYPEGTYISNPEGGTFSRVANILDAIHPGLAPQVWDDPLSPDPKLKSQHGHWIRKFVYHVLEKNGYANPHKWLHLVLTGSLTTYQYSDESDVDISLFIDAKIFPEWSRAEMIGLMIDSCDGVKMPGTPFPLQCFVVAKTMTPADLYKPGMRSGYDVDANRWIVPPDHNREHDVAAYENGSYVYALEMADKMERLLRYEPDKAEQFQHTIHQRRARDMAAGKGDFAQSNIIYKFLVNRHLMPETFFKKPVHTKFYDPKRHLAAWEDHFVNQINPIADAYDSLPSYDPRAVLAWQELAQDSTQRANQIRNRLNVQVTDNPEPYANAQAMFQDINKGNFQVSRANSEHPIWTPDQNVDFRIVHDVLGHHPSGGDFGWQGENQACGKHFGLLTPNAQQALMTECLGQTGSAIRNGGFGPQKVGLMSSMLAPAQTAYNRVASVPAGGFCHRHIRHGRYRLQRTADWIDDRAVPDIDREGGGTFHPVTGESPTQGYQVSQLGHTVKHPEALRHDHEALAKAVRDFVVTHWEPFEDPNNYVGTWTHGGSLWLEPSENVLDSQEAIRRAKERNQISIWDNVNKIEIPTGGTGYDPTAGAAEGESQEPQDPLQATARVSAHER